MPKLPEENKERDFELLDKAKLNRGAFGGPKQVIRQFHSEIPKKLVLSLSALVVVLVVIYIGASYVYPMLTKKKVETAVVTPFEYPLNINDIKYPSDAIKLRFMDNFNKAKEVSGDERYKLLETNYLELRGLYTSSHGSEYRLQLDVYKAYMEKGYPDKVKQNEDVYTIECMDTLCGKTDYPDNIAQIKDEMANNKSLDPYVADFINLSFESAINAKDTERQKSYYLTALSSIYSEYQKSKDEKTLNLYKTLANFITTNYGKDSIPDSINI